MIDNGLIWIEKQSSTYVLVVEPLSQDVMSLLTQGSHAFSLQSNGIEYAGTAYAVPATLSFTVTVRLVICNDPSTNTLQLTDGNKAKLSLEYSPG